MKISFFKIIFVLVFGVFCLSPFMVSASTTDNMSGYAWSSNIGWISFNCTNDSSCATSNYGVTKNTTTGYLTGNAWSSNIGWIQFGGLSGWTTGGGTTADNAKADGSGNLTGWAKALSGGDGSSGWDGWISLSGTGYGVILNGTTTYAWGSEVVGWIDFSGVTVAATTYTVTGTVSGSNGTISPASRTVNSGSTTTFTVTPNAGYTASVSSTCGGGSFAAPTYTTGPITANCTVTATFTNVTYTVTGTAGANGTISPASRTVNSGSTTTFTVTPNAGYTASVSSTCGGGSFAAPTYTTGPITSNCTVTASFALSLVMSGTLTASICTIASGASTCTTTLSWSINNTEAIPSAITSSGMSDIVLSTPTIGNSYSGTKSYTFTSPATRTFYLYNNAKSLVPTSPSGIGIAVTATCVSGTSWDGTKCAPILIPVDGYYSGWGPCDASCTQTGICIPPQNGGLPCSLPAPTQSCTGGSCIPGGQCSSPVKHYKCLDDVCPGGPTDHSCDKGTSKGSYASKWTWICGTTTCSERKTPGYIEN